MYSTYSYWRTLLYPEKLADDLQQGMVTQFKRRVLAVFALGLVLFLLRDAWGMHSGAMTYLLAGGTLEQYTIGRLTAFAGTLIWSLVYMAFHFFGVALILQKLTNIPYKPLLKIQLAVLGLLLIEKAMLFVIFLLAGKTASVSVFSFGPLAATFFENWFLILFVNQLTIFMALVIAVQYRFIRSFEVRQPRTVDEEQPELKKEHLLLKLIGLNVVFALVTAGAAFIPVDKALNLLMIGGL